MILVSSCICLCPIYWSQVLSRGWRCSWSGADRRCSNYIWVINNLIAYYGASVIRDLTVYIQAHTHICVYMLDCSVGLLLQVRTGIIHLQQIPFTWANSQTHKCYWLRPWLIIGLRPANERRRYFVTTSIISWAQAHNQPWRLMCLKAQLPALG